MAEKTNKIEFAESSRYTFIFYPAEIAPTVLKDRTRCLVKNKAGFMDYAVWFENGGWEDEGALCWAGGCRKTDVVEFALDKIEVDIVDDKSLAGIDVIKRIEDGFSFLKSDVRIVSLKGIVEKANLPGLAIRESFEEAESESVFSHEYSVLQSDAFDSCDYYGTIYLPIIDDIIYMQFEVYS